MVEAALCRDCGAIDGSVGTAPRCAACGSPRLVRHPDLHGLAIAHLDCDAFFAAVEKRDRPELRDRAVIVGGGRRGVVSAACYTARLYGVHSAMPMFKALERCPDAAVIRPDGAKYSAVGRQIRSMMEAVTPLVEPLSIDEAFLDLSGTDALHGGSPARTCARLAARIEAECGVTVSIGLAPNKFLAKLASDLDKPRGFAAIGRAEAEAFLGRLPVDRLWGVGKALTAKLAADGIATIGQLRLHEEHELVARYGSIGRRLHRFARGRDDRPVTPGAPPKSVSAETTFDADLTAAADLRRALWPLCEKVADKLKRKHLAGRTVTLKLKTAQFRTVHRAVTLPAPTQLADTLFRTGAPLADAAAAGGARFRLIGIGAGDLVGADYADPPDLLDPGLDRRKRVEAAIDAVRAKLGRQAIAKGRAL
jgi:DNA polymerase-4